MTYNKFSNKMMGAIAIGAGGAMIASCIKDIFYAQLFITILFGIIGFKITK